ncbi:hypothetical protein K438DRAFT_1839273 [Mycena galopus ATCC 62051]|nr:hypothetical protein K438DRAFT_1839273 [Mycena galopus ATCC 62051]
MGLIHPARLLAVFAFACVPAGRHFVPNRKIRGTSADHIITPHHGRCRAYRSVIICQAWSLERLTVGPVNLSSLVRRTYENVHNCGVHYNSGCRS